MASRWWWVVGWALAIELLLLWPSPPDLSRTLHFGGADKVVHAALFAVQAWLATRALQGDGRARWPALVGTIAFGVVTELQQHLIPSRAMELGDLAADSLGASLGFLFAVTRAPRRREYQR